MSNLKYNANGDVVGAVEINGTTIMQPIDIQSRLATTIQTHNAVSVAATTGISTSSVIDCAGYDQLAITFQSDAVASNQVEVVWNNVGTSINQGSEVPLATSTARYRAAIVPIKARYCTIVIYNTDAAAHTISVWAYLKA